MKLRTASYASEPMRLFEETVYLVHLANSILGPAFGADESLDFLAHWPDVIGHCGEVVESVAECL